MGKLKTIFNYYFSDNHNFLKFWNKNRENKNIPKDLRIIIDKFSASESFKFVSKYWNYLNIKNLKQIINDSGIENYANTVALNYFTFLSTSLEMEKDLLKSISDENYSSNQQIDKHHPGLGLEDSKNYNRIVLKLFALIKKLNLENKLKLISDKGFVGFNDPFLNLDSVKVTSDKLNSLLDYKKFEENFPGQKFNTILEIGAGSGRFTEVFLTFNNNCKYIICDIPPSIYINYIRQKKVFQNKKIKLCFDMKTNEEFLINLKENDIIFIFPHQIELLKKNNIDVVVAIDCIHEMDKKTIKYYFENINRFAKKIYFSVWDKTSVPLSSPFKFFQNRLNSNSRYDYQIPNEWEMISNTKLYFPNNSRGISYKIKHPTKEDH